MDTAWKISVSFGLTLLLGICHPDTSAAEGEGDGVTCEKFSRVFGGHHITKLKKDSVFPQFKGTTVTWVGNVVQVDSGAISGTTVSIRCLPNTLGADVVAFFGRDEHPELVDLRIGQRVAIQGQIESWGEFLPHSLVGARLVPLPVKSASKKAR